jgi:hypothetical protein
MSQNQNPETPNDPLQRELHESLKDTEGEFPEGRLNLPDQGQVTLAIGIERDDKGDSVVVLRFPKPVAWFGVGPAQAMEIAVCLMKHARRCGHREPLVFRVGGDGRPPRDSDAL